MSRASTARALILCGWGCYLAALACPAVECSAHDPDVGTGFSGAGVGVECLLHTFTPGLWLFAPLLVFYGGANLLMLGTPLLSVTPPTARRVTGVLLLYSFCFSLTVPLVPEVSRLLVGCYLWVLSFLLAGLGFLLTLDAEARPAVEQATSATGETRHMS